MPKELEHKLMSEARRKGLSKEREGAYVYGNKTMKKYLKKKRNAAKKRK